MLIGNMCIALGFSDKVNKFDGQVHASITYKMYSSDSKILPN
jgi:hypothetical protein